MQTKVKRKRLYPYGYAKHIATLLNHTCSTQKVVDVANGRSFDMRILEELKKLTEVKKKADLLFLSLGVN